MSEVKWIKIKTNIFDDEKIKFIETMPDSDTIIVIWFKLLAMAGRSNNEGYIMLTETIPYTQQMLTSYLNRKETVVQLAMDTFQRLDMIDITDENAILISNWSRHQNLDGMEKIRIQTRERVQKYRDKQKQVECNVTRNATVTQSNALDKELEEDKELKDRKEKNTKKEKTELEKALEDFELFRKKIKAPLTPRAKELLIKKLDKMEQTEENKIKILEQSILNGWKGIYDLKSQNRQTDSKLKDNQTYENTKNGIGHNL
jgi:predicted phage replisome organizer